MTQNTTKKDKRDQCDTKHNALKTYLAGENIFRILLAPTRQQVYLLSASLHFLDFQWGTTNW
jgi:hypothetical protein